VEWGNSIITFIIISHHNWRLKIFLNNFNLRKFFQGQKLNFSNDGPFLLFWYIQCSIFQFKTCSSFSRIYQQKLQADSQGNEFCAESDPLSIQITKLKKRHKN
jgi:hypothetical protein